MGYKLQKMEYIRDILKIKKDRVKVYLNGIMDKHLRENGKII